MSERDMLKKPKSITHYECPRCSRVVYRYSDYQKCMCGQSLDWSDFDEYVGYCKQFDNGLDTARM